MPDPVTHEEAWTALEAIGGVQLNRRRPGNWYCSVIGAEIKSGCFLKSPTASDDTPELAILHAFSQYTQLDAGEYVVIFASAPSRRAVLWSHDRREWMPIEEASE